MNMENRRNLILWLAALIAFWLGAGNIQDVRAERQPECAPAARLVKVEGQVSLKPAGKVARITPTSLPYDLCTGDVLYTFAGHAKVVDAKDGRYTAILDAHSSLKLGQNGGSVEAGSMLFEVKKQGPQSGVQITTRLSVIGVKGTRFLVSDSSDGVRVAMDEGRVEITSTQGRIGLYQETTAPEAHSPSTQADYERFLAERSIGVAATAAAFEAYREATRREFVAYVESLQLSARRELLTQTGIAVERDISTDSRDTLSRLRPWL